MGVTVFFYYGILSVRTIVRSANGSELAISFLQTVGERSALVICTIVETERNVNFLLTATVDRMC